jgi:hypothetical protein
MLLNIINIAIGVAVKKNKSSVRDIISLRNCSYVIRTRDGTRGRRYIFRDGKYSSDTVLDECDLALVFENDKIGFNTLAFGGETGLQKAMNNYELILAGNQKIFAFFAIMIGIAMGKIKRR